ncbi:MAG: hypothetical protein NZ853_08105 [Leptospiraceae bacterium]|nr:hypothetical protein [Leptospiraceae bacterium]MDW7976864.1 hypothetical protein [Leptospiraceae bacterium]
MRIKKISIVSLIVAITFAISNCTIFNQKKDDNQDTIVGFLLLQALNPQYCTAANTKDHQNNDVALTLSGQLICDGNVIRGTGRITAPDDPLANASITYKLLGDDSKIIFYGSSDPNDSNRRIGFELALNQGKAFNRASNKQKDLTPQLKPTELNKEYRVCLEIHYENCKPHLIAGNGDCGTPRSNQPAKLFDEEEFGTCGGQARGFEIKNAEITIQKMYSKPNFVWPHD